MQKIKLFIRIMITVIISFVILIGIDKILKIKHNDKLNTNESIKLEWDWIKENTNNYYLLDNKYFSYNSENYPLILMKNSNVPEKKEGEKRILVVGDSFIFGTGLNNTNYTWWKQLNLQIKKAGYSNVEIYAAGKYGYSTKNELDNILLDDTLIKKINPDLIIIGYVYNDPEERDENGELLINDIELIDKSENNIYKKSPTLYYELVDRLFALDASEYDKMIEIGETLGGHRWDAKVLYMTEGEKLERYKQVLKDVNNRMNELDIPYFFAVTNNLDNILVEQALEIVQKEMKNLSMDVYYPLYDISELLNSINSTDWRNIHVNPVDHHPGIVWTNYYSKMIFEKLKKDYSFIFENAIMKDINDLELNINDTIPFLNILKQKKNVFEFEYPLKEETKELDSNFLYYPIEKNYIKLNLEYPKNISKIIVTGKNLKSAEIYVNTINPKLGYDVDEAFQKVTSCEKIGKNTYEVNYEITSVNIVAEFKSEDDRTIKIEFVE